MTCRLAGKMSNLAWVRDGHADTGCHCFAGKRVPQERMMP
jgi:hypothetical protein